MLERIRWFGRVVVQRLDVESEEEREKRAAHLFALLLVALVATFKHVTGVTLDDAPFTLFAVAIAASAARGGLAPAIVATLASMLLGGAGVLPPGLMVPRLVFGAEGLGVALIVCALKSETERKEARLDAAHERIGELKQRDRQARTLEAALLHLEQAAGETAVVVLDERGMVAEWRPAAQQLYGYPPEQAIGGSPGSLFSPPLTPDDFWRLLEEALEGGPVRRTGVHERRDRTQVQVDFEIRPFRDGDARGFTLAVHDLARRHEWDDYREAAARAQAALQQAADEAQQQLRALESLTDPSLNPLGGAAAVTELLERLRGAVRADGVGLVQPGRPGVGLFAESGLQPGSGPAAGESLRLAPGRVAVVHNDAARVAQLSSFCWPADVTSLLAVPVVHDGQVWSAVEIVSERSRQVSDWDVALVRVVADRLAAAVVQDERLAARAS